MGGEVFASLLLLHALPQDLARICQLVQQCRQEARQGQNNSYCGIRGEPRDLWHSLGLHSPGIESCYDGRFFYWQVGFRHCIGFAEGFCCFLVPSWRYGRHYGVLRRRLQWSYGIMRGSRSFNSSFGLNSLCATRRGFPLLFCLL